MIMGRLKNKNPQIILLDELVLAAECVQMSFANDMTATLWKSFAPKISSIPNRIGIDRYSVQVYPDASFFDDFSFDAHFKKYAAIQVADYDGQITGVEKLVIKQGEYAVFDYIGRPSHPEAVFKYIFYEWLPSSSYELDNRPHMAVMGEGYKGEHDESEEKFFIPLRMRQ